MTSTKTFVETRPAGLRRTLELGHAMHVNHTSLYLLSVLPTRFLAMQGSCLRIVYIRVDTDGRNHRRRPGVLDEASRQSADTGASGPELILYLVQCLCHVRCPVRSCANILRVADLEALRIPYMLRPHCSHCLCPNWIRNCGRCISQHDQHISLDGRRSL